MIVVPPKTLDTVCSAPVEDLPVWGGGVYRASTYGSAPPELLRKVILDERTGDMWGFTSSRKVYKKGATESIFSAVATIGATEDTFLDIAIDLSGWVYVFYLDYSEVTATVYRIHPLTFEVVGPLTSVATDLEGYMAIDTFTGDIYYTHGNVITKYTNSTGVTATHATITETAVVSISINPTNKNLYVGTMTPYNILLQAGGTGAFAEIASDVDYVWGVSADPYSTAVYCYAQPVGEPAEIFKLPAPEGEFTSLGSTPYRIGAMFMLYGDAYVTYATRLDIGVFSDTSFLKDEYVIYNYKIYLALADSLRVVPPTDTTKWFEYCAVNNRRAFDGQLTSLTEVPDGPLFFTLTCGALDSIGLFNLVGTHVILTVLYPDGVFYEETRAITERNMSFLNLGDPGGIAVYHITVLPGSSGAACGGVVGGVAQSLGRTGWGVNVELVSYSKVTVDDFGRPVLNQRGRAKRVTFPVHAEYSEAQGIYEIFNENDAKFCMWQGDASTDFLLLYGIYKRLDLQLKQLSVLQYSFEVLGDVDTPTVSGEFTLETPPVSLSAVRARIAEDGRTVFIWFDGEVQIGADGVSDGDFTLYIGEASYPLTYIEGEDGICLVLRTAEVVVGETYSISYTQPGDGIAGLESFVTFPVSKYFFMQDVPDEYSLWYVFIDGEQTRIGDIVWDGTPTITSDGVDAGAGPEFNGTTFATINQYSTLRVTFLMDSATSGTLLEWLSPASVYVRGYLTFDESGLHVTDGTNTASCEATWEDGDLVEITVEFDRVDERMRVGYRII